jgi:hypothetical protein
MYINQKTEKVNSNEVVILLSECLLVLKNKKHINTTPLKQKTSDKIRGFLLV